MPSQMSVNLAWPWLRWFAKGASVRGEGVWQKHRAHSATAHWLAKKKTAAAQTLKALPDKSHKN